MKGNMLKIKDSNILSAKKLLNHLGINCCLASASSFALLKKFIKKRLKINFFNFNREGLKDI